MKTKIIIIFILPDEAAIDWPRFTENSLQITATVYITLCI